MTTPKNPVEMTTVKVMTSAAELARIAAAIRKEKLSEYVSRVVSAQARQDIDEWKRATEANMPEAPPETPKRPTRPRKDADG